ncbi:hypothetical protein D9758_009495 [Tetrapyrgos nigripes]|uniref:Uncharacterized protein n=1 Tax=Tetrapyrgos nigripes TaxID=182062 RepID=A0A8H5LET6_9AGAR|nr:hypothetical protein D9758_009495 [Tetrapyrgos nigripes]
MEDTSHSFSPVDLNMGKPTRQSVLRSTSQTKWNLSSVPNTSPDDGPKKVHLLKTSTLESSMARAAASAAAAEPLLQRPSSPPPRATQTQTHAPSASISNRNATPVTSRQPQARHH